MSTEPLTEPPSTEPSTEPIQPSTESLSFSEEEDFSEELDFDDSDVQQFDSDNTTLDDYFYQLHSGKKGELSATLSAHIEALTKVIASIPSGYLVKRIEADRIGFAEMKTRVLRRILEKESISVKVGSRMRRICLSKLLDEPEFCQNCSAYDGVDFLSDDPNIFSLWTGYEFDFSVIGEVNMDLIKPFLDYVKDVICAGNEENYNKEMMKNAWMYQNPNGHLTWATVLIGEIQISRIYTDLLCDLWGKDWAVNINTKLDDVVLRNKKLVVTNKMVPESRMKDDYYKPHRDQIGWRNVNNFIILNDITDGFVLKVAPVDKVELTFSDEMKTHLLKYFLGINTAF
jgi:hypothetical protein